MSYILKAEPMDDVLGALGTKRDWLEEPTTIMTLDEPWNLESGNEMSALRVKTGHFTVNCALNIRTKADRLLVLLSGARGVGKEEASKRSHFLRRDWDPLYQCPILAISDPAVEKFWGGDVPRAGLYLGNADHDLVPELNALIDKTCEELGIKSTNAIIMGASAGGSSAALIASRRKVGRAIAVCAPIFTEKYRKIIAAAMQAVDGSTDDWVRISTETPYRTHPLAAIRHGVDQGNDVRIVFAQNTQDPAVLNKHFGKMAQRLSINPTGGGVSSDGTVMGVLYDDWEGGHGFESKPFSRVLWKRSLEYFETKR
jgi:pimeloyl-ACP methyl ester carboxylesterase